MVGLNEKAIEAGEASRRGAKPFRILIEQIELASKFGSAEDLELACNELLSSVKYDTYQGIIKRDYTQRESVGESSNPAAIFEKMAKFKGEKLTGARIIVTCGHCGNEDKARYTMSGGHPGAHHIEHVLDNFPKEL